MEHILLTPLNLFQFQEILVDLVVVLQTKLELLVHILEEVETQYLEELTQLQIKDTQEEQEEINHMLHNIMVPVVEVLVL